MGNSFKGKHLLDLHHWTRDEISYVVDKALEIEGGIERGEWDVFRKHDGLRNVASLFFENSTRTRESWEEAIDLLGYRVKGFGGTEGTSVNKGEELGFTGRMYEAWRAQAIGIRHNKDGAARALADIVNCPVVNLGDGKHAHPTQAALDMVLLKKLFGRIEGLDVGVGADLLLGRAGHSFALAAALMGARSVHQYSHPALMMPDHINRKIEELGAEVVIHDKLQGKTLHDAVKSVDFWYHLRVQEERFGSNRNLYEEAKNEGIMLPEYMEGTRKDFKFGHPLPENKEAISIDPELYEDERFVAVAQAAGGVSTRLAILGCLLGHFGDDFDGEVSRDPEYKNDFLVRLEPGNWKDGEQYELAQIKDGTVIDHLPLGTRYAVEQDILGLHQNINIGARSGRVPSRSNPHGMKDMVMIPDVELTEEQLVGVAAYCTRDLGPNEKPVRVTLVRGGQAVEKWELRVPNVIAGPSARNFECSNLDCISRPGENQHMVDPTFYRQGDTGVECRYCEHPTDNVDLLPGAP